MPLFFYVPSFSHLPYVPSFFYMPYVPSFIYVSSFFACLTCHTCPHLFTYLTCYHFLRALRVFIFYVPYMFSFFLRVFIFLRALLAFIFSPSLFLFTWFLFSNMPSYFLSAFTFYVTSVFKCRHAFIFNGPHFLRTFTFLRADILFKCFRFSYMCLRFYMFLILLSALRFNAYFTCLLFMPYLDSFSLSNAK